jgi:ribokinase
VRFGVVCGAIACTRLGVIPGLPQRAQADALYAEAMKTVRKEQP